MSEVENPAVSNFREYIRIKTDQPNPDYGSALAFLQKQAADIGLGCEVIECVKGKPIVVMTWPGTNPSLSSLLLNSHTDVVPVNLEDWKYDPFEAVKDKKGDIYGRGTQDMKSVGIQYLEAIRRLKKEGKQFLRTIHLSFVPEEENSSEDGMKKYVKTEHFQSLNVGFALDEGVANPQDAFNVYYGERFGWVVYVTCTGDPGHGSLLIENNAAEKLRKVINSFLSFRDNEEQKLKDNPNLKLADVTSVNMVKIIGGNAENVVPSSFTVCFNIRVTPFQNVPEFEAMIAKWCAEAGPDVKYEYPRKVCTQTLTSISLQDPWWSAFKGCMDQLGEKIDVGIFPAATDSYFLRELGYPALGFSPMNHTPVLLHDNDEFLNEGVFLHGIDVYSHLIPALANVPAGEKAK